MLKFFRRYYMTITANYLNFCQLNHNSVLIRNFATKSFLFPQKKFALLENDLRQTTKKKKKKTNTDFLLIFLCCAYFICNLSKFFLCYTQHIFKFIQEIHQLKILVNFITPVLDLLISVDNQKLVMK
uniref:Transmembrane protein n=1 Tax=Onchocerca volvulus TaxID=6282 RepID=A0A8R1Y5N9_ONCVO